jgi:hypothetical protein
MTRYVTHCAADIWDVNTLISVVGDELVSSEFLLSNSFTLSKYKTERQTAYLIHILLLKEAQKSAKNNTHRHSQNHAVLQTPIFWWKMFPPAPGTP